MVDEWSDNGDAAASSYDYSELGVFEHGSSVGTAVWTVDSYVEMIIVVGFFKKILREAFLGSNEKVQPVPIIFF